MRLIIFSILLAGCSVKPPAEFVQIKQAVDASAEYCAEEGQVWQPLDAPCHDCEEFAMKYQRDLYKAGYKADLILCLTPSGQGHMMTKADGWYFDNRLTYLTQEIDCEAI